MGHYGNRTFESLHARRLQLQSEGGEAAPPKTGDVEALDSCPDDWKINVHVLQNSGDAGSDRKRTPRPQHSRRTKPDMGVIPAVVDNEGDIQCAGLELLSSLSNFLRTSFTTADVACILCVHLRMRGHNGVPSASTGKNVPDVPKRREREALRTMMRTLVAPIMVHEAVRRT
jgi:hypothetical protein